MKTCLLFCAFVACSFISRAQVTWAADIAPIVYSNCTSCHRDNGIAPFSLMTYEGASAAAFAMMEATQMGMMPPWPPDTTFQEFSHERVLNAEEIALIAEWANSGAQQGNPALAPPPPVYPEDGVISTPWDLELVMPEHTSAATMMNDDYSCFAIPTGLLQDRKLRAYEVIPGNPEIVHHALVFVDPEANYPTNTSGNCMGPQEGLFGGYTPGAVPGVFPSDGQLFNLGVTIPAGSNIILAMHYPHGSAGMTDQTKVRLWFYPDAMPVREVFTAPVLQNWSFFLPANQITEVNASFNDIPLDISIFSVFPHMHLLGKSIESFAISPLNDTIPFVRINQWMFHWQQFYAFRNLIRVPANSTMYGHGVYDNTSANMHNPNNPPQTVFPGLNTQDEMFLIYFQFTTYLPGDELIDLESLTEMPVFTGSDELVNQEYTVFPNPASNFVTFQFNSNSSGPLSIFLYDVNGKLVERIADRQMLSKGGEELIYPIGKTVTPGMYYYSVLLNGALSSGKLIIE